MKISKNYIFIISIFVVLVLFDKNLLLIVNLIAFFYYLYSRKLQKQVGTIITLLSIPIIISGFQGLLIHPLYDVFKDIYYLLNPIMFFVLGLLIAKKTDINVIYRSIIIVGSIFAIYYTSIGFIDFGFSAFKNMRVVRDKVGGGNVITIITLVLCIFSLYAYKLQIFRSSLFTKILIVINGLSLIFSASRTFLIIFILLTLTLMYPIYRHRIRLLLINLTLIVGIFALYLYFNSESGFANSLLNSGKEISIGDYTDPSDRNSKYRGWESYRAYATYIEGNAVQLIIGLGAGKMINLGSSFFLAGEYRHYIPILHNGYMYALVKAGILGVICYLFYFIYIFRFARKKLELSNIQNNFQPLFLIGLISSIYVTNIVVASLYNTSFELLGLICGVLFYYLNDSIKTESIQIPT